MLRTGGRQQLRVLAVVALLVGLAGGTIATAAVRRLDGSATVGARAVRVDPPAPPAVPPEFRGPLAVVDLVNVERLRRGEPALAWHDQVAAAAVAHSTDMAARSVMSHIGSDGSNTGDRLARQGFPTAQYGEAIGAGQQQEVALFQAWMASPSHRQILLGDFQFVGVAAITNTGGTPYWTLVVASPP